MSRAKVEQYKIDKANRKKTMAKEKAKHAAVKACAWIILIAVVGWAGYSGFRYYGAKKPAKAVYTDVTALSDYVEGLNTEAQ